MERKSCCSGMRCGSTPRVTITPEKKPMNVNYIKKEEQDVKPQTLKKEVVVHEASTAAAVPKGVKVEGKESASATVKKEGPVKVKKEGPVKVNVGCGGGSSGCSSFK